MFFFLKLSDYALFFDNNQCCRMIIGQTPLEGNRDVHAMLLSIRIKEKPPRVSRQMEVFGTD